MTAKPGLQLWVVNITLERVRTEGNTERHTIQFYSCKVVDYSVDAAMGCAVKAAIEDHPPSDGWRIQNVSEDILPESIIRSLAQSRGWIE